MRSTTDPLGTSSFDHPLSPSQSPSPHIDPVTTTFFLSRNPHVSESESSAPLESPVNNLKESMYRVQSLETLDRPDPPSRDSPESPPLATDDLDSHLARRRSTLKANPVIQDSGQASPVAVSRPLTPLTCITDDIPSLPGSPKSISNRSFRPLDEISITDEMNSQAASSGDEAELRSPQMEGGAPQLIMPSIKMPSRPPFTERGKAMGRFKILLAGASGESWPFQTTCVSN